ncbi:hypothetical protein B164 [Sulfolobus turreted icosahedral virus 1]|uniref:Uncharacterized protein n=1 Tax=Sulfolobus turreted icosahedral virus 1 TaxID=269145 RepID=Q6Q0J1_9VIRU|nr:terminase large subunit [Sulfolobus turreted icosahedral virus 1]AAS89100.1 hypothetical protein B164 [Sulfolobus turreted icosahedral virus 1]
MNPDDIVVIIGRKRSGKSYLIKHYFIPVLKAHKISYIIDDHNLLRSGSEYSKFGYNVVTLSDIVSKQYVVVYDREKNDVFFEKLWNGAKLHAKKWGTSVLIIDEAYYHFKYRQKVTPAIDEALHANRHAGIGLILSTQRVYDLMPIVYKQADLIIMFIPESLMN